MSTHISIASEDRDFFRLVADAAMANPFSERRDRLDGEIAGVSSRAAGDESILADALVETGARLRRLAPGGCWRLDEIRREDREAVELAILFEAFHAHRGDFDALLSRQRGKAEAVDFPFAGQLIDELEAHGIGAARAHRALELFYQMHRAFRFISGRLIGQAPSMRRLREALWNQVFTENVARYERFLWNRMEDFSTLLLGETGTGKTAAAAAIGRAGFIAFDPERGRYVRGFDGLFSALNLSEFPVTLLESELFGHAKGAFTGAEREHEGALSRVPEHGTIFLDEIGELGIAEQVKLLRVLQERSYRPLGARSERRFEGRVIAATHRSLDRLRAEGRFRDDFYFRLCTEEIIVPTLRERIAERASELELLSEHLIARIVGEPSQELLGPVLEVIERDLPRDYAWPGNVRELEQRIRRVLLNGEAGAVGAVAGSVSRPEWLARAEAGSLSVDGLVAEYCAALHARLGSYEEVGRRVGLDRRTVKKHVDRSRLRQD